MYREDAGNGDGRVNKATWGRKRHKDREKTRPEYYNRKQEKRTY